MTALHEREIATLAEQIDFPQISLSSEVNRARGDTTVVDPADIGRPATMMLSLTATR